MRSYNGFGIQAFSRVGGPNVAAPSRVLTILKRDSHPEPSPELAEGLSKDEWYRDIHLHDLQMHSVLHAFQAHVLTISLIFADS
jgi:hypothetical protein